MTLVDPDTWKPQGVDELEEAAWEAIRETQRSVSVTAGAGAGKTEFLAQKATYLLQTGLCPAPKRILAISFKRDAASTLTARVERRCPPEQARRFVSVTFDAFAKGLVDQFRTALPEAYRPSPDYVVSFPTADQLADFFRRVGIEGKFNTQQFPKMLALRRLRDTTQKVPAHVEEALEAYWKDQLHRGDKSFLSFPMMNRLVEYLLRTNERIRAAIRITYPVIFLDEFQDTQTAQFELLTTAFGGTDATLTAVGDLKQSIMGWAGAMEAPFTEFASTFKAKSVSLKLNWRSNADLVAVQNRVAKHLDPDNKNAEARAERAVDGAVSAIWEFADEKSEINTLADWIANEVHSHSVLAHDLAVLVRSRADQIEKELGPALAARGVPLRNIARNVGEIAIQDLLSEELTEVLLPLLRLGATRRHPDAWSRAQRNMRFLLSVSTDDEIGLQRANERVEHIVKEVRAWLAAHAPERASATGLIDMLVEEIGESLIRRSTPTYNRDADFHRVHEGMEILLADSLDEAADWSEALDRFEGLGQVPLMTVHKSKGMEFHTVIFFGLDSQTWWSLKPNSREEINSFFVTFTRAKQRAFFTSCSSRGNRIAWLDDLLGDAVPRVDGSKITNLSNVALSQR